MVQSTHIGPDEIVDAFGTFHSIGKNAFNAFSLQLPTMSPDIDLRSMDFGKVFNQLGGKLFGDMQEEFEKIATPELRALVETASQSLEAAAVAKSIEMLSMAEESIPAVGFLLSLGTNYALNNFFDIKAQQFGYSRGEWIQLDLGERSFRTHSDLKVQEMILQDSVFGGGDFMEESSFETSHEFAIGFYVGPTSDVTEHTVFNFKTGLEEVVHWNEIRGLPQTLKEKYDENPELSQIREVRLYKDFEVSNSNGINTDPGVEVTYDDEIWNVVSQRADTVEIENFKGQRKVVAIKDLQNHRLAADTSYRYEGNSASQFMGFAEQFTICALMWVWIKSDAEDLEVDPDANGTLGCVRFWVKDQIMVCKAWTGEEKLVEKADLVPVEGPYKDCLRYTEAKKFQQCVSDGRKTVENRLGDRFGQLCFTSTAIFINPNAEGQREARHIHDFTPLELTNGDVYEPRVTAKEAHDILPLVCKV